MRREMAAGSERKLPQDLGESADGHDAEKNRSERPRTEAVPGAKPSGDRPLVATGPHLPSLSFAPCARHHLRQEPSAGNPLAGICAGGTEQSVSLPRHPPPPDAEGSAILTLKLLHSIPRFRTPNPPERYPWPWQDRHSTTARIVKRKPSNRVRVQQRRNRQQARCRGECETDQGQD